MVDKSTANNNPNYLQNFLNEIMFWFLFSIITGLIWGTIEIIWNGLNFFYFFRIVSVIFVMYTIIITMGIYLIDEFLRVVLRYLKNDKEFHHNLTLITVMATTFFFAVYYDFQNIGGSIIRFEPDYFLHTITKENLYFIGFLLIWTILTFAFLSLFSHLRKNNKIYIFKIVCSIPLILCLLGVYSNIRKINDYNQGIPETGNNGPNVLILLIETLRADHLSAYGYEKNTSANLNALAEDGVMFSNYYVQSSWTLPSCASLFTSKYVSAIPEGYPRLSDKVVSIPSWLKNNDYRTAIIVSTQQISPLNGYSR